MIEFNTLQILQGSDPAYWAFNYFFSLVSVFGLLSVTISMLVKILTRS